MVTCPATTARIRCRRPEVPRCAYVCRRRRRRISRKISSPSSGDPVRGAIHHHAAVDVVMRHAFLEHRRIAAEAIGGTGAPNIEPRPVVKQSGWRRWQSGGRIPERARSKHKAVLVNRLGVFVHRLQRRGAIHRRLSPAIQRYWRCRPPDCLMTTVHLPAWPRDIPSTCKAIQCFCPTAGVVIARRVVSVPDARFRASPTGSRCRRGTRMSIAAPSAGLAVMPEKPSAAALQADRQMLRAHCDPLRRWLPGSIAVIASTPAPDTGASSVLHDEAAPASGQSPATAKRADRHLIAFTAEADDQHCRQVGMPHNPPACGGRRSK